MVDDDVIRGDAGGDVVVGDVVVGTVVVAGSEVVEVGVDEFVKNWGEAFFMATGPRFFFFFLG